MVTWRSTSGNGCGVALGLWAWYSLCKLSLCDRDRRVPVVETESDLLLLLGVASLYPPFVRSRGASSATDGLGDAICIARTDAGLRNGGRSLRGEYRESRALAGGTGLEATEISDGSDETKLLSVIVESRRAGEGIDGRDVYEPLYGSGSSCRSPSMLGIATSAPENDISDVKDTSPSSDGEGGSRSSGSS